MYASSDTYCDSTPASGQHPYLMREISAAALVSAAGASHGFNKLACATHSDSMFAGVWVREPKQTQLTQIGGGLQTDLAIAAEAENAGVEKKGKRDS